MKAFFSYFGSKYSFAGKLYHAPRYKTIVEPFAGSAAYAAQYYDRDVVLCDKNPVIVGVWDFLIKSTRADIMNIGMVPNGGTTDDLRACQEAKWLVGFWLQRAAASPGKSKTNWSKWDVVRREIIASQVGKIKHWKVHHCSYENVPAEGPATWFIDPPYQVDGKHYKCSAKDIDFKHLGDWCRTRVGQSIVCENQGADWLPFERLRSTPSARQDEKKEKSHEVVWYGGVAPSKEPNLDGSV